MNISQSYEQSNNSIRKTLQLDGRSFSTEIKLASGGRGAFEKFWKSYLQGKEITFPVFLEKKPLRIADVFSSCGGLSLGLSLGFSSLGFQTKHSFAIDVDADALQVYKRNFAQTNCFNFSVSDAVDFSVHGDGSSAEFINSPALNNAELEQYVGRIDVLCGGPPCQGHSNLNNVTRRDDLRNLLYLTMPALGIALRAPVIIIENVPLVIHDAHNVVETTRTLFEKAGYQVFTDKLMDSKFGGVQTRERFFMVALKTTKHNSGISQFLAPLKLDPRPVSLAISDLQGKAGTGGVGAELFDTTSSLSEQNVKRIKYLFRYDKYDLPLHQRPDCHKEGTSYQSVYGRMYWDEPAGTITTGFQTPGRGRFVHPREPRCITPHEAARIQFFPDSYQFMLSNPMALNRSLYSKWIGDAVPPKLGYLIGLYVASHLI
jgi:DNA (cytosine-5)-methyltransferase 1